MILHASAAFVKRFKCSVSDAGPWRGSAPGMDRWSCHFVRLGTLPVVVAMHDATLYALVLRVAGMKTFEDFCQGFLLRVAEVWQQHGAAFDPANQTVVVLPRADRSRIGSMNDAIMGFRWQLSRGDSPDKLEALSNRTPYKAIGYQFPGELLGQMLREPPGN